MTDEHDKPNAAPQSPCYSEVKPCSNSADGGGNNLGATHAGSKRTVEDQGQDEASPRVPTQTAGAAPAPTPRTDKLFDMVSDREQPDGGRWGDAPSKWSYEAVLDLYDFARQLERELAAAVDEKCNALIAGNAHFVRAEKAEADAKSWRDQASDRLKDWDEMRVAKEKAEAALDKMAKERDGWEADHSYVAAELAALQKRLNDAAAELPSDVMPFRYGVAQDALAVTLHDYKVVRVAAVAAIANRDAEIADMQHDITRLHDSLNGEVNARITADAEIARLREVITDAQKILSTYIVPDSGITDFQCINDLLGLLDGPKCRAALDAAKEGK